MHNYSGFVGAGIPLGVTFAFLISSPLVNESSLYLFPAMFGMKVTIIYNVVGILISMIGGFLIQKLGMEKYIKPELLKFKSRVQVEKENGGALLPLKELLKYFCKSFLSKCFSRSVIFSVWDTLHLSQILRTSL